MLLHAQQRLVFVIFARRKSANDLYASHDDGIFIGKRVAASSAFETRNVVKGHLSSPPPPTSQPTVSVYRTPMVTAAVTNEPK